MKFNNRIYDIHRVNNFRELINSTVERYGDNVAYKFKKNFGKSDEYIEEKTYKQIKKEVEGFSTSLLNLGLENKKVVIISNNRYEWCVSYLAITTGNMIVVPLDKALQEGEIRNLIQTSNADVVIFEDKFAHVFEKIREEKNSNLKVFINIDLEKEQNGVLSFQELVNKGCELISQGNDIYSKIVMDDNKMSILLFTSGTTSNPKGVML